nr:nephrin-like [Procambarus clarkii]
MTSHAATTPVARWWYTCLMVSVLAIHKGVCHQQEFSVRPESVEVPEGADVFLSCVVDHQEGKAQWTKDGFALGFDRGVPGYPRYQYAGDPEIGEHHLVINGVTLTEDGEYQCQVGPTDTSPPIWAAANVTVLLAPTRVWMVGWGKEAVVEVVEGTILTLECVVEDARPPPTAAWYRAGLLLHPEGQVDRVEPSTSPRRWSVRSQVKVSATPGDDGRIFSCQAVHPALSHLHNTLVASVSLSVLHAPGPPVITGYAPDEILLAGERRTLTCRSSGGNPRPWVLWYRQGRLVDDTTTTVRGGDDPQEEQSVVNDHQLAVTPQEDGAMYECHVSSDLLESPLTANVTLTVYYAPSTVTITGPAQVEAGGLLNLTCESSDSNPPASLTWTIQGEPEDRSKSVVGRDGSGGWVTSTHLTHQVVPTLTNLTHVTVECRALNPAIERVVKKVTTVTLIRPAGRPVFESELSEALVAGTILDLTCVSVGGHPPPSVRVYKGEQEMAAEVTLEGGVSKAVLEVEVQPADNGVEVKCEVHNPATLTPLLTSHNLSVLFPPWEVTGSVRPSTVEEDQVVTLTCDTSSSLPPSSITWRSQKATLQGAVVTTTPGLYGGTHTRSELQVSTTAEDNGRSFTCEANNGLGVVLDAKLVLNVLHSPVWVVRPAEHLDVYEGAQLVITASAAANPGPLRYWWRRGEVTLEATEGELRLGAVNRDVSGNYSVNAYNPRGAVNASFLLNVMYGPENIESAERVTVGEGGAATLQCSATGNPPPTLTWTRHTHNSTAETLSTGVGVARLVLEETTWAATGVYLCHASNLVSSPPPVKTKVIVTQAPTVATEDGGALGASWAAVGGEGRLVCRVRAAPAPTFVWTTHNGRILDTSEKYVIHDPQLVDGLVVWAGVLEVRAVTTEDYAHYICTAHNPLGSDAAHIALHPPARPHTPFNFTVTNMTESSVSLAWTPNFSGGLPRGYTVRYRPAGTINYQFVEISGGHTAGTTLGGLRAGAEYFFSIMARNDQGVSEYLSPPLLVTLHGVSSSSSSSSRWRVPRLILLIMTLTGAALLVLNIAIIACFVRRRRSITRHSSVVGSPSKRARYETGGGSSPPTPTPIHHHQLLLSLSTTNSSDLSNTLTTSKEDQSLVKEGARRGSAASSTAGSQPTLTQLQNGGLNRKNSGSSPRNGGLVARTASGNGQSVGSVRENGIVPTPQTHGNGGIPSQTCSSGGISPAATSLNGRIPGHIHPHTNPEVCSLASSTYDTHPASLQQQQQEQQQRRDSGSLPADDQVSVCSYQSSHSRTYSQGYVRPLPPPGCPHHPSSRPQPLYQGRPYHQQQSDQQTQQQQQTYTSLNPSSLYTLSADYFDTRCGHASLTSGPPLGYATLGPRSRRATTSQFATLQRPRPALSAAQSAGHQCPAALSCQGADCCHHHDQDDSRGCGGACHSHPPRRSSFHGPLRPDPQRYDAAGPASISRLHLQHQHQRQDSAPSTYTTPHHQNSSSAFTTTQHRHNGSSLYGTTQQHSKVSGEYSRVQHPDGESPGYSRTQCQEVGSTGYSVTQQESKGQEHSTTQRQEPPPSKDQQYSTTSHSTSSSSSHSNMPSTATTTPETPHQAPSTRSPSHSRHLSLRGSSSFRSAAPHDLPGAPKTTSGRPRFPHDYVRQGSTRGRPASSRPTREATDKPNKLTPSTTASSTPSIQNPAR